MKLSVDVEVLHTLMDMLESLEDDDKVGQTPGVLDLKDKLKQANAKWRVVKRDETSLWRVGAKVWGVYLVDMNEITLLCEVTPSHCLYHLYNVADTDDDTLREEIESYVSGDDENIYLHCSEVKLLPHHICGDVQETDIEDSYEIMVEAYCEHYRGNHVV